MLSDNNALLSCKQKSAVRQRGGGASQGHVTVFEKLSKQNGGLIRFSEINSTVLIN